MASLKVEGPSKKKDSDTAPKAPTPKSTPKKVAEQKPREPKKKVLAYFLPPFALLAL